MTGNALVDMLLVILVPVVVWGLFMARTREVDDAEAMILGALAVAPRHTLTEAELQRHTGLNAQELALVLDRLHDQVRRSNGRVTLR